ncbi:MULTISPECIES: membrane protein insertase YidC [Sphingobacterium]|uniref:Membrane protein insertase YidC n=1 Tax=Sphingobacterium cellulitidis TaxID=1768011 RepID=A0A8H9G175_9SPHI|nr:MULTISPECIES: membrane protein insertase YidC [Sphingobacterium]MBA8987672.1 YidC/Oxa1 family membrane protein insertase [Sphingobacterium soli]WFB64343.1 membrane protein insertase YidC [Sphingobacterium sp. WM]GGE22152.1 membrane protein insertase YidC [Sphingobacterium soli]
MDRNNILGFIFIFAILAGSFYFLKPSDAEIKKEQQHQDSIKRAKDGLAPISDSLKAATTVTPAVADSVLLSQPFGAASVGSEQIVTLENELIKVNLTNKGGRVKSVELKGETNFDGSKLILFEGNDNRFGLEFNIPGKAVKTNDLFFQAQGASVSVAGQDSKSVTMRLSYAADKYIDYIYTLKGNDYNVQFDIKTVGIGSLVDVNSNKVLLNWETTLLQKERNVKSEREKSAIFYREDDGSVDHLSESSDDEEKVEKKLSWIAFKQHFFSSILTSKEGFVNADLKSTLITQDSVVKHYRATTELALNKQNDSQHGFSFFFGPNKYKTLKAEGNGFEKIINMGWGPMGWINKFITVPIFDFLDGFNMNYGIVILILTLFLKLLMFPLTYKSYQSMGKMRVLKPQLDEIKAKVGDDNPMLLQQEQMKLYKQAGVNPLGGCLPLLLQMPFTLAFFFFFPNLFELRGESFLWIKDLSTYDAPITFAPLPLLGVDHISFMCILMTLTTLLTTWYNNSTSGAVNNQMKYIGYIMPLVFFFVLNSFPAGLNYYYFLSAVLTFLTQVIIRQFVNDDKILAGIEANKKKPKAEKKQSSFQKKMEEMMRAQQAAQQNKDKK